MTVCSSSAADDVARIATSIGKRASVQVMIDTGMTRSVLAGRGLKEAKTGTTLGRLTMQLYYTTDFADRLENEMLPALRAGNIAVVSATLVTL